MCFVQILSINLGEFEKNINSNVKFVTDSGKWLDRQSGVLLLGGPEFEYRCILQYKVYLCGCWLFELFSNLPMPTIDLKREKN